MVVLAEGIERPAELERLRRLKADLGQGFLFAPPMELDRLIEFVRERASDAAADSVPDPRRPGALIAAVGPDGR